MLSFYIKFWTDIKTERQTPVKQYTPIFQCRGHNKLSRLFHTCLTGAEAVFVSTPPNKPSSASSSPKKETAAFLGGSSFLSSLFCSFYKSCD